MDPELGGRTDYRSSGLEINSLQRDPFDQLRVWLADAFAAEVEEPNAMAMSTVGPDGRPSSRMVLLREIDFGLCFYTNYRSRKGSELEANPFACMVCWWPPLHRQVRVEGRVERVAASQSDAYFASRPRRSQLASAVSPQSEEIDGQQGLEQSMASFGDGPVARPEHWGGYRLIPDRFEFWQGRPARLHDRFVYVRAGGHWRIVQLAP